MAQGFEQAPENVDFTAAQDLLVQEFWARGDLSFKLKAAQKTMWKRINESDRFKYVIKCARRLGKSYFLVTRGTSTCLIKEKGMVRYAAPTAKAVRKIVIPLLEKITADCPPSARPIWKSQDGMWVFPETGAQFHVAGVNNGHADDLRGTFTDDFLIDEAGTIDELHYLVHDVAMPQLLDRDLRIVQGRRLIVASSPPRSPAHEFTLMANLAEVEGWYSHYDIFDGEYSEEIVRLFLKEDGISDRDIDALVEGDYEAILSTTVKREYLALDVVDENYALCPEWKETFVEEPVIDEYFQFWHKYEALDVGVRDLTVCLFAHYDFKKATLFIHDEVVMSGPEMTTEKLAQRIRDTERLIFWDSGKNEVYPLRKRVSDIDLLLIQDLNSLHKLYFEPTDKGELEQMVNEVRIWVNSGKIRVSEKCKQTLGCLRYGVWEENRRTFDRSAAFGHYDAFAALMYLVRNVDQRTNPVPFDYNKPKADHWIDEEEKLKRKAKLKAMFNLKKYSWGRENMAKKSQERVIAPIQEENIPVKEKFIRIIPLGRGNGHYDMFQAECIEVVGDKVIGRELIGKPNLYEYAYSGASDLLDPRNEVRFERAPV